MTAYDIKRILNSTVKSELNMLYTEPPFMTPAGLDFGLFCREHAYHTYFLCRLSGYPVEIKIGHYFVLAPEGQANITLDSGADHAWCATRNLTPLDLSMTFHLTRDFPNLAQPVLGTGQNGPYIVRYMVDEILFRKYIEERPDNCCICYFEKSTFPANEEVLLKNPFSFLLPPAVSGRSWADVYGSDIFAKITLHLYKVALGHIKPLHTEMKAAQAVIYIKSKYSAAIPKLQTRLEKNAQQ